MAQLMRYGSRERYISNIQKDETPYALAELYGTRARFWAFVCISNCAQITFLYCGILFAHAHVEKRNSSVFSMFSRKEVLR
jgi:hypothetical protein